MKPYYEDSAVTIYHGDCRDVLPGLTADVMLTDPPWLASDSSVEVRGTGVAPKKQRSMSLVYGEVGKFEPDLVALAMTRVSHDCLILTGYKELGTVCNLGKVRGVFGWYKPNGAPARFYPTPFNLSFIVWHGKRSHLYGHQHWRSAVFTHPFPAAGCFASERYVDKTGAAVHPSQGPESLYRELLLPFPTEATILDPFMGSGTTLRAAKDLGRKAIGIEIEERYCEIAALRMSQSVMDMSG